MRKSTRLTLACIFVLVVLCRGVGNAYIGKIGIIRTVLSLVFLTAEIINEMLHHIKGGFGSMGGIP